ncbi:family 16 glycoside hydrolase [Flavobacterium ovatum]|uniref:family 16 glycoside hydrolase n=1 Tax=Flavobacterium ovatum TaxID=1928857 RepID=UPI00344E3EE6
MKNILFLFLITFTNMHSQTVDVNKLISKAKLVFEDNFNRNEKEETIEDLGLGWRTNSKTRAGGHKQADLRDGKLFIEMYKEADHSTSILHSAPFDDGIVKVKFQMLNPKGFKLNFNDPKAKELSHAGHICQVSITPNKIGVTDQITGVFGMDIYNKRKDGVDKKLIQELLKDKSKTFKTNLELNHWYEITIVIQQETISVFIDNQFVGELKSAGFDHKEKENIALSLASSSSEFDDLRIWSLD